MHNIFSSLCSFYIVGCDSVSAFFGKGKLKPFKLLSGSPEFVDLFKNIGREFTCGDELLPKCESFVCQLYNQSDVSEVNKARSNLFNLGLFNEESMPCTQDVLSKHLDRSNYQAAIWRKALTPTIHPPDITNHGWIIQDGFVSINWMALPPAPDGILENVNCGCKTGCSSNRCSCFKENLTCTPLCRCQQCTNSKTGETQTDEDSEDELDDTETQDVSSDYDE